MRAPRPEFARPGANPTLETVELIRAALRNAEEPLSRNRLLGILHRWKHSTNRPSLNAALGFLADEGHLVEGSKGIVWLPEASPAFRENIRLGRPL